MKPVSVAVVVCVLSFLSVGLHAQEKKKSQPSKPHLTMEEMTKRWQESATPGDAHKRMAEMEGQWDTRMTIWMGGPGSEPSISKGAAEFTMIMDGRFLQQTMTGEMMGVPMTGMGFYGYDNFKKKYTTFWIDNTGTATFHSEGVMEKDGKTITYWGKMDEPATGEKDKKVKYVLAKQDESEYIFRIYDVAKYGENEPVMEIEYTRVD
jgi:hypothetical protein